MSIDYTEVKAGTILKVPFVGITDDGYMYLVVSKIRRRQNKIYIYASHTVRYCDSILIITTFDDPYEYTEEESGLTHSLLSSCCSFLFEYILHL